MKSFFISLIMWTGMTFAIAIKNSLDLRGSPFHQFKSVSCRIFSNLIGPRITEKKQDEMLTVCAESYWDMV